MPIATHGHDREHPRVHGQLPVLEAFIVLGIASMLAAAVIVWSSTEQTVREQSAQQQEQLNALRKAASSR